MSFESIIVFIFIVLGMGHTVLHFSKAKIHDNLLIALLELSAVGLGIFSFMGIVLKLVHIPIHYLAFMLLAIPGPIAWAIKSKGQINFTWKKEETFCAIGLFLVLIGFFALYYHGATGYPYLEDDDPWNHAQAATYISRTGTYDVDPAMRTINGGYTMYLEPYPPTFDIVMGVMRQTNDSIVWTLKFFNVLIITLALAFTYLFARVYLKSDMKALFATIVLAALPSFMSHFIWSQTIALALFPVALYAIMMALTDKNWRIPAIIMVASELVTQPVVSFVFGIIVLLLIAFIFLHETTKSGKWKDRFSMTITATIVGAGGLALSLLYWGAQLAKWGVEGIWQLKGGHITSGWGGGYSNMAYSWHDIIFAPNSSGIDQAIGIGIVGFIVCAIALVLIIAYYKKTLLPKKGWITAHLLAWFILIAYNVLAPTMGLPGWGSLRFWAYLAIPFVLLLTEGIFILINGIKGNEPVRLGIAAFILVAIIATSLPAKIDVQTAQWPPGAQWTFVQTDSGPAPIDLLGYMKMTEVIPKNSRVYYMCGDDSRIIGFDMQSDPWDRDISAFRETAVNATGQQVAGFLIAHNYEYFTLDAGCAKAWGVNETNDFAARIGQTGGQFSIAFQQQGFALVKVNAVQLR